MQNRLNFNNYSLVRLCISLQDMIMVPTYCSTFTIFRLRFEKLSNTYIFINVFTKSIEFQKKISHVLDSSYRHWSIFFMLIYQIICMRLRLEIFKGILETFFRFLRFYVKEMQKSLSSYKVKQFDDPSTSMNISHKISRDAIKELISYTPYYICRCS